jgi:hypothetical protein
MHGYEITLWWSDEDGLFVAEVQLLHVDGAPSP